MRQEDLLKKQFAVDFSERVLTTDQNVFVTKQSNLDMRYWARGAGSIVCYRDRLFVRTNKEELTNELKKHYQDKKSTWLFEMEPIETITAILKKYRLEITRLSPFFIPKGQIETPIHDSSFVTISKEKTQTFQTDERIKEAFCYSDTDPDMLGIGYYDKGQLKAVCGANRNGQYTWEIGVEILDEAYTSKGIATALVKRLTATIQAKEPNVVPIYGTAFSHAQSMNVAINSGFKVGWSELLIG